MVKGKYTNESIMNGIRVLRAIAEARSPLGSSEIAGMTGLTKDFCFRALCTLDESGVLVKVGDGYELGKEIPLWWARHKARIEAIRDKADRDLAALNSGEV